MGKMGELKQDEMIDKYKQQARFIKLALTTN